MMNDKQLQQSGTEELSWDPSITSAHIGVSAKDGVVTLIRTQSGRDCGMVGSRRYPGAGQNRTQLVIPGHRQQVGSVPASWLLIPCVPTVTVIVVGPNHERWNTAKYSREGPARISVCRLLLRRR
jgi:hypothetical protein